MKSEEREKLYDKIRELHRQGKSQKEIKDIVGCGKTCISEIVREERKEERLENAKKAVHTVNTEKVVVSGKQYTNIIDMFDFYGYV